MTLMTTPHPTTAAPDRATATAQLAAATNIADRQFWQAVLTIGDGGLLGWDTPTHTHTATATAAAVAPVSLLDDPTHITAETVLLTITPISDPDMLAWVNTTLTRVLTRLRDQHATRIIRLHPESAALHPAVTRPPGITITNPAGDAAPPDAHIVVWATNPPPAIHHHVTNLVAAGAPVIRVDAPTRTVTSRGHWGSG